MIGEHETKPQQDEPILCVRFTRPLSWIAPIVVILTGCWLIEIDYELIIHREYLRLAVCLFGTFCAFGLGLNHLLTRHILFYRDRVVKVWFFFGERSIPYSRALLIPSRPGLVLRGGFALKDVMENGWNALNPIPVTWVLFSTQLVSREMAQKVYAIVGCLAGVEDIHQIKEKSRRLQRTVLPKELP